MEAPRSFEAPRTESFVESLQSPEAAIDAVSAELERRFDALSEAPATCELQGRQWECAGDTRRELIGHLQERVVAVSTLRDEVVAVNQAATAGSPAERATYEAVKWLSAEAVIIENELLSTCKRFEQADLEERAATRRSAADVPVTA